MRSHSFLLTFFEGFPFFWNICTTSPRACISVSTWRHLNFSRSLSHDFYHSLNASYNSRRSFTIHTKFQHFPHKSCYVVVTPASAHFAGYFDMEDLLNRCLRRLLKETPTKETGLVLTPIVSPGLPADNASEYDNCSMLPRG